MREELRASWEAQDAQLNAKWAEEDRWEMEARDVERAEDESDWQDSHERASIVCSSLENTEVLRLVHDNVALCNEIQRLRQPSTDAQHQYACISADALRVLSELRGVDYSSMAFIAWQAWLDGPR